jgi:hypothetical protein
MEKGASNIWIIISFVLVSILFFLLGTSFPDFLKGRPIVPTPSVSVVSKISPTESITPTLKPSPTIEKENVLLELQQAFGKKYNRPTEQIEVTIDKKDDRHIAGGVKFSGETGGGWFLAYKGADGWMIVQDGNGTVSCEIIAPYNFPKSLVPECVDKNGNLVK